MEASKNKTQFMTHVIKDKIFIPSGCFKTLQKKLKLSMEITYRWESVCKIYIIYEILSTDLYPYVKSALHTKLSTDSNPYIKSTLHTNFYVRICIQDITYGFNLYINSYII